MNRLSCNEITTYRWTFEEDVANYVRAGWRGIGVWRQKLSDFGEERGIELVRETGLTVSNLLWAGGFTGSDGRSYRDSVVDAREAIATAADLRAGCLVLYSGARGGHTHTHALRLLRDALDELLPIAEKKTVPLAIEPVNATYAAGWSFLADFERTADLIAAYQSPCLKIVYDTYYYGCDAALTERLSELAPLIAIVHLADGRWSGPEQDRTPLFSGEIPLCQIVQALEAGNYSGWYDLELMGQEIETSDYAELLHHSKQAFEHLYNTVQVD